MERCSVKKITGTNLLLSLPDTELGRRDGALATGANDKGISDHDGNFSQTERNNQ
jgi:hypothetical protein